jgi:hypothetical protein
MGSCCELKSEFQPGKRTRTDMEFRCGVVLSGGARSSSNALAQPNCEKTRCRCFLRQLCGPSSPAC